MSWKYLTEEAQTRNISCDIFIFQVEFITEVLLTVLVCNLRTFPGEIWTWSSHSEGREKTKKEADSPDGKVAGSVSRGLTYEASRGHLKMSSSQHLPAPPKPFSGIWGGTLEKCMCRRNFAPHFRGLVDVLKPGSPHTLVIRPFF